MSVLSVRDLSIQYRLADDTVYAADDVSFDIPEQTIVGMLGESGSGKSTVAQSLVRILPDNAVVEEGTVSLDDEDIFGMDDERLREVRWDRIAYIPQSAMGSLDPIYSIREQLLETIDAHEDMSSEEALRRTKSVLDTVGISHARLDSYPHELSGGMRQRILVAMSLILEPDLVIADEPTTGLDVLIRDRILSDLEMYRDEFGVSILFISHDIADLVETCDSLLVMYGGKLIERGPSRDLFDSPTHPYTIGLKNSLPHVKDDPENLISMSMEPPENRSKVESCVFVDRCPYAVDECREAHPLYFEPRPGIDSACYRTGEAEQFRESARGGSWNE